MNNKAIDTQRVYKTKPLGRAVIRNRWGHSCPIQCATDTRDGRIYKTARREPLPEVRIVVDSAPAMRSKNGALFTRPASGNRNRTSGGLNNVGSNGNYWVFASNSRTNARNLNFNSGAVNPTNTNNRANGLSVLPARELGNTLSCFTLLIMNYTYKQVHEMVTMAYLDARQNERNRVAQLAFEISHEDGIAKLAWSLYKRRWEPSPMDWFVIDYPLVREVFCPRFTDRIVSHVLFNILSPIFERYFIFDSYSCRKGKGTGEGIFRFEHHLRGVTENYTREAYVLNIDISGYFMSIVRSRLYEIIADTLAKHKLRFPDAIDYDFTDYLVRQLVFRDPTKDCRFVGNPRLIPAVPPQKSIFGKEPGVGIPIGDVNNQLNSNIYLNVFDQYAKRVLGIKHYCRYVDDVRIMHKDYGALVEIKERCGDFLKNELSLTLHPTKTNITSSLETNFFLGAAFKPFRIYAKNDTMKRFRALVVRLESSEFDPVAELSQMNSRLGYLGHFQEWKFVNKTLLAAPKVLAAYDFNRELTKATIKH